MYALDHEPVDKEQYNKPSQEVSCNHRGQGYSQLSHVSPEIHGFLERRGSECLPATLSALYDAQSTLSLPCAYGTTLPREGKHQQLHLSTRPNRPVSSTTAVKGSITTTTGTSLPQTIHTEQGSVCRNFPQYNSPSNSIGYSRSKRTPNTLSFTVNFLRGHRMC